VGVLADGLGYLGFGPEEVSSILATLPSPSLPLSEGLRKRSSHHHSEDTCLTLTEERVALKLLSVW